MISSRTTFFLSILLVLQSCGPGSCQKQKSGKEIPLPASGKIHPSVPCSSNPGFSYALYLPSQVGSSTASQDGAIHRKWPVIVLFDPGGSGLWPVKKYAELAEKQGYILMGSNNSRNGLSDDVLIGVLSSLFSEIFTVYPVDTNRIYLAGFSGGSRTASFGALIRLEVKGVIGCGAGFPGNNWRPSHKFDYFGMVGNADFNMNEMLMLGKTLDQYGFRHFIRIFDGGHTWPPKEVMAEAFSWNSLNAMKDNLTPRDENIIMDFKQSKEKQITLSRKKNNLLETASHLQEMMLLLNGLENTDSIQTVLGEIQASVEYRKQIKAQENSIRKEQKEQQILMESLFTKDLSWWKKWMGKTKPELNNNANPEDTLLKKRLVSFLSQLCYSNANAAMKQNEREVSENILRVYEVADPENPEPNYLYAKLLMQHNDTNGSLRQLKIAVDKGFSDKNRAQTQVEFESLKNNPAFFDLLQKMK